MAAEQFFPCCLTIAGSDSGGNAGVQADLRAFHSYGVHGCTVFAALTAQNPFGVAAIHQVPVDFIASQLDAVLGIYNIAALKTGMLADTAIIECVGEKLSKRREIAKVIDPVMVATSGAKLISDSAVSALKSELFPLATVITPNLPEAEVLAGSPIANREDAREAAKRIFGEYGCSVLVKGGHALDESTAVDTLYDGENFHDFALPKLDNPVSTHGTGCSLAAALAAELALGRDLKNAVEGAKLYVYNAIKNSYLVGKNCGVLGWVKQ